jgi:flagellar motor switch protein FliG
MDQYFAIYDHAAPTTQNELIKALETQMPQLVEKIRTEMFSFDDLITLDSTALRTVFREVPLRTLAMALMGTTATAREKVLTVLPQGAAEIIRQEIEMNPIKSAKTIDDERRKIVQVVRKLVWDKKIVIPPRRPGTKSGTPSPAPATA